MDFIDLLSIFLPALAFICILFILVINLFAKIRSNKLVEVNCWFCNQWTRIPHDMLNSWDCPLCEQYNGFTKDGDYNKVIPEQHDELMNKVFPVSVIKSSTADNGLCSTCNNNQQLKVQQLAMFCPIDENKFEEEVERYEKQLERAYRLCPQCELTVKRSLHKQKSILLGLRLLTLRKEGLNLFNLNKSSSGISKTAKRKLFLNAIRYITVTFAIIHIFGILKTCDLTHRNIINALPGTFVPLAVLCSDITLLIYNCFCSVFESLQFLQKIVLGNFISLFQNYYYIRFEFINLYLPNFLSNIFQISRTVFLVCMGFFLQFVFLLFHKRILEFIKCVAWLLLLLRHLGQSFLQNNLFVKMVEVLICCFLVFYPSSIETNTKVKKSSVKKYKKISNEKQFSNEVDSAKNVELLNSTFNSQCSDKISTSTELFNKNNSSFNSSSPVMKLFNITNKKADDPLHLFGKKAMFENPLSTTYFNFSTNYRSGESSCESSSTRKSSFNDSLNSSYYCDKNDSFSLPPEESLLNKPSEQDWFQGLNDLHLSTSPKTNKLNPGELPSAFKVSTPFVSHSKPILSPPRLKNATQSSWVAGGYWKSSNDFLHNTGSFSNLSRSSSQSSGFGSQTSSQQPNHFENNVFNSLPPSRTNSVCGEFDRFSVLSEPVYQQNPPKNIYSHSRFYPILKPDQQIYICSKSLNDANQQRLLKSPTSHQVLTDGLCSTMNGDHIFNSPRPCSQENNFAQNVRSNSVNSCPLYNYNSAVNSVSSFNINNPFYLHTSTFGGKNVHPLSINSNKSAFLQPYEKGSLLKKWREQNCNDINHQIRNTS